MATLSRSEVCLQYAGLRGTRTRQTAGHADRHNNVVSLHLRQRGMMDSDLPYQGPILDTPVARSLSVFTEPIPYFGSEVERVKATLESLLAELERSHAHVLDRLVRLHHRECESLQQLADTVESRDEFAGFNHPPSESQAAVWTDDSEGPTSDSSRSLPRVERSAGRAGLETILATLNCTEDETLEPLGRLGTSLDMPDVSPSDNLNPDDLGDVAGLSSRLTDLGAKQLETSEQLRFVKYLARHHEYLRFREGEWLAVYGSRSRGQ